MSTDPAYRRRGYGRTTLLTLLAWLRSTGITMVDLHATPDGEPLYRSLGFTEPTDPALTLRFPLARLPTPVQEVRRTADP
jgi:GNAT superfamily N-acetyltransferase